MKLLVTSPPRAFGQVGGAAEGGARPAKGNTFSPVVSFVDVSSERTHGHLKEQKSLGH